MPQRPAPPGSDEPHAGFSPAGAEHASADPYAVESPHPGPPPMPSNAVQPGPTPPGMAPAGPSWQFTPPPAMPPSDNGKTAWGLGFLAYIPVPILNSLVTGLVQNAVGLRLRKHGGMAAANGVRAANWGLTQVIWSLASVVPLVFVPFTIQATPSRTGMSDATALAILAACGLYLALGLTQLIYAIVGTITAGQQRLVRLPVLPFHKVR